MTKDQIHIHLSTDALNLDFCRNYVAHEAAGGEVIFVGTVRNQTKGKTVKRLEFEAYEPMAISEMRKIAERAVNQFGLFHAVIHHQLGVLDIGEIPVIIAVSAAHRGAAFEACQFCIDTLKQTVPIWKKEIFEDGEVWVSATP